MTKILGIDLGTTNSAMAVVEAGESKIIENTEGNRTTPSVAAISKSGDRLVGLLAKRQAVTNPKNTVFSVKRLIGRKFSDEMVQKDKKLLPYDIRESANGGVEVKMTASLGEEKWYRPEEVSAMILSKLKADAEAKLGAKIDEAIITVPAYFDDSQRKATKDAGEIAGFKVRRILNEPTAAALAYGFNKKKNEQIVVYDFGGGTFDVSVDTLALQRLKEAAEKAKHELSSTPETEINVPFITSDSSGPRHLLLKLGRAKLENLVKDYLYRSIEITDRAVKAAGFALSDIDEIILVGGQTRMPAIVEAVKKLFGKEPIKY